MEENIPINVQETYQNVSRTQRRGFVILCRHVQQHLATPRVRSCGVA